eukprot:CAMPEP_0117448348 /NCGR_PEP_ID=MMETSP0759-20121206/7352_1 /TAXON_ID=63605 /ORGANISM="Percolomonas cosmopolitus, Strain WS" /LENGTH=488 /DNA_ID=CAMNT_0005240727 /DNA_START=20 /DNA_END=1486 /DNA_ORIENTATION=+
MSLVTTSPSDLLSHFLSSHPYRTLLDLVLVTFILYIIFKKPYNPNKDKDKPTEEEINELCKEWKPEPLVPLDTQPFPKREYTASAPGPTITVGNQIALNFATFNFLGLSHDAKILEKCKGVIDHYGVGSCGPRGFYGSQKTHIDLEKKCFEFFGTEDCILYSYGFATVSSVIPAFCKRTDLIIVDEGCSYPIQHGAELSRATVKRFRHNDMEDLERILKEITTGHMKKLQTKQRRYIITQGIFENTGDLARLKRIVELKHKYKIRLMVDDSFGAGVLGKTGRGIIEHCGCEPSDVDILVINLENALGGVGGVCLGSQAMVRHQRLMGLAFTFSASLPPYTSAAAVFSLESIEESPQRMDTLRDNIRVTHRMLTEQLHPRLRLDTALNSPIFHLRMADGARRTTPGSEDQIVADEAAFQIFERIASRCLERGLAVSVPKYSKKEWMPVEPSLRLTVSSEHSHDQISRGGEILREIVDEVFDSVSPTKSF